MIVYFCVYTHMMELRGVGLKKCIKTWWPVSVKLQNVRDAPSQ